MEFGGTEKNPCLREVIAGLTEPVFRQQKHIMQKVITRMERQVAISPKKRGAALEATPLKLSGAEVGIEPTWICPRGILSLTQAQNKE